MGMNALREAMPTHSEKDFTLVNRKTGKSLWKSELCTKRNFKPLEIKLAPFFVQPKEIHLMDSAPAVVSRRSSSEPISGPGLPLLEHHGRERILGPGRKSWLFVLGRVENQRDDGGQHGPRKCPLIANHQARPTSSQKEAQERDPKL